MTQILAIGEARALFSSPGQLEGARSHLLFITFDLANEEKVGNKNLINGKKES